MKSYLAAIYLWAISVLFSYMSARIDLSRISYFYFFSDILPLISAIAFLTVGYSRRFFLILCVTVLLSAFLSFPLIPNHRYVMLFATILLLVSQLQSKNSPETYFNTRTVSALRGLLVVVYFFAFFVKLNDAYLDPTQSCAVVFYRHLEQLNNFLPTSSYSHYLSIYGSIIVELALPILYILKFYRAGLFLGVAFHFVLALDLYKYFTNFSSVMFLLLITACGCGVLTAMYDFADEIIKSVFKTNKIFKCLFLILISLTLGSYLPHGIFETQGSARGLLYYVSLRHALWFAYSFFIILFALKYLLRQVRDDVHEIRSSYTLSYVEAFLLLLAILNGLTPFLGLKTRTGFNMYSNLRIEPHYSNHLCVGQSPDVGGYLSDLGLVLGQEGEMLCNKVLYSKTQYPIFEILRAIDTCPLEDFTFIYQDKSMTSTSPEAKALISQKTNTLERFFLTFKPIGLKAENECIW